MVVIVLQHPFVYSITPSYGPVAGGTDVLLRGGWLDEIDRVNIADDICIRDSVL